MDENRFFAGALVLVAAAVILTPPTPVPEDIFAALILALASRALGKLDGMGK